MKYSFNFETEDPQEMIMMAKSRKLVSCINVFYHEFIISHLACYEEGDQRHDLMKDLRDEFSNIFKDEIVDKF